MINLLVFQINCECAIPQVSVYDSFIGVADDVCECKVVLLPKARQEVAPLTMTWDKAGGDALAPRLEDSLAASTSFTVVLK